MSEVNLNGNGIFFYVDGSFNEETSVYGYGIYMINRNLISEEEYVIKTLELFDSFDDVESATMRNVAGEVTGALRVFDLIKENKYKEVTIVYDYTGIEYWATKKWKANKTLTKKYQNTYEEIEKECKITFVHVTSHTGVDGNEKADKLAKKAVGLL